MLIGISISIMHEKENLWSNGIKQNAFFLAETLRNCPSVNEVIVFNTSEINQATGLPKEIEDFDGIKDRVDLVIELGSQISEDHTSYLKNRGCRLVSYCCGFEYIHSAENILFRNNPWMGTRSFINQRYDALWMIPQVESTSRPYFEVLRRIKGTVVPFVWSPAFLDNKCAAFTNNGVWSPHEHKWRLSIFEPNINIVKFCLYPIFIAELAYRKNKNLIEILHVNNADHLANFSQDFTSLMWYLDIVNDGKTFFHGRHDTPTFLYENTDAVISHQWENPLNYIYLEIAWQGYPLIHNAQMCKELGYYYDRNDLESGSNQLISAIENHNYYFDDYIKIQRKEIERFLPNNFFVIAEYERLISDVKNSEIR